MNMDVVASVVEISHVATRLGGKVVHADVSLAVAQGEIFAIAGGSGSGKSTLMREIIGLARADAGSIKVLGVDPATMSADTARSWRPRLGVLFQQGGLFGALNVLENVGLPLREHTSLDERTIDAIAASKIAQAGLEADVATRLPAALSGGMAKRACLARALALDPEILFLDEPTAGLDPASADGFDTLILNLRDLLGMAVVMVTHDLDLLWHVADRVAVLGDGRVAGIGSMAELRHSQHPAIRPFFEGLRGGVAARSASAAHAEPAALPITEDAWKPR